MPCMLPMISIGYPTICFLLGEFIMLSILRKSSTQLRHQLRSLVSDTKYLYDKHDRVHNYLRISITDRCNLRCSYCMPEDGVRLTERENYLTLDELKRLANIFVIDCGVNKIRLTGGEPTIDKKCIPLLGHLNELRDQGLKEIAMTTNGLNLKRNAASMRSLGLNSINISLDTLKERRFETITRRKGWKLAIDGFKSALAANFDKIKLNCVMIRGFNDDEVEDFVRLASQNPIEVRFIEFMPFLGNNWDNQHIVPGKELLERAMKVQRDLKLIPQCHHATSKVYSSSSMLGSLGFINSMSDNFCSGCNRLRITSDGQLKVCLFGKEETSLRDLMRNGANDREIVEAILASLNRKEPKHAGADFLQRHPTRPMVKIVRGSYHGLSSSSSSSSPGGSSESANEDFSHLDPMGNISMVNVGSKPKVKRVAIAEGRIHVGQEVLAKMNEGAIAKGNVISLSKVAGIMGAKLTSQLIPLCHSIPLDHVQVDLKECTKSNCLIVTASVQAHHNTGVEMESLTAVSVTLLSIYDMCKSVNKTMTIKDIKLLSKRKL